MVLKVAARGSVPPFIAMDVLRDANKRAAEGEDVLHLEVGQPGTPAPEPVLEAVRRALKTDLIGYTDALGLPHLRRAIAAHYERAYGLALDPARVVVTTGSSGGFLLAFLGAFDAGDRVAFLLRVPRKLYVDDDGPAHHELHVTDLDGNSIPYITGDVDISDIAWAADGKSIFFGKQSRFSMLSMLTKPMKKGE